MPLNWVDRQDEVDDILAEDINKIAHSVIDLEKNSARYANAIKAVASGTAIRLQDVSPIEHELKVNLSDGNSLYVFGKNLYPQYSSPSYTLAGITMTQNIDGSLIFNGTATGNFSVIFSLPYFFPKNNYVLSLNNDNIGLNMPDGVGHPAVGVRLQTGYWVGNLSMNEVNATKIIPDTSSEWGTNSVKDMIIVIYSGTIVNNFTIKPQLELGTIATEYEPYIEPETYPVNADGTVDDVTFLLPVTSLFTDNKDAQITVEYNRDANAFINNLAERIIALENAILNS